MTISYPSPTSVGAPPQDERKVLQTWASPGLKKTYYAHYFPAGLIILVTVGTDGMLAFGGEPADWPSFCER